MCLSTAVPPGPEKGHCCAAGWVSQIDSQQDLTLVRATRHRLFIHLSIHYLFIAGVHHFTLVRQGALDYYHVLSICTGLPTQISPPPSAAVGMIYFKCSRTFAYQTLIGACNPMFKPIRVS